MTPQVRRRVAGTWAFRTRAEIEASARFRAMAAELAESGASPEVVEGVRQAARDEERHAGLCARVAARYGRPDADEHEPARERVGRADMPRRDRLLWEMTSVCCLAETMNVALLTRCLEVTEDEELRQTLRDLLRDEVRHSRLGWAHLAAETAQGRGAFLSEVLPLMLEASVHESFFHPAATEPEDLSSMGELSHAERLALYRDTLEQVVFPGLESMGIDASRGRTWLGERLR